MCGGNRVSDASVIEQQAYYQRTAEHYDAMHVNDGDEHGKALAAFMALAELHGPPGSILDVGAGTGRGMNKLQTRWPSADVFGVEPVEALRLVGHRSGLGENKLVAGDALNLGFPDNHFDYAIETGVLHHIQDHRRAVSEMARVSRKGVMISDSNNLGQGSHPTRFVKSLLTMAGLWPAVVWVQTHGRMYKVSEGDGVYYSYSAFASLPAVRDKFPSLYVLNTAPMAGVSAKHGAAHVMIFATR